MSFQFLKICFNNDLKRLRVQRDICFTISNLMSYIDQKELERNTKYQERRQDISQINS
ncbi:unnamed protein product [Paramecium primaurelia]|uniref:Uncharacterized protein n=1 Tax=Paramecium primaurelia TaxID=5886 RepID=A0A8S1KTN1_PARPR|nr:unnamed protein product [Paramecium primaurelia]